MGGKSGWRFPMAGLKKRTPRGPREGFRDNFRGFAGCTGRVGLPGDLPTEADSV